MSIYSSILQQLAQQSPELAAQLGMQLPTSGTTNIPRPQIPAFQRPQLGQLPQFLPNTPGFNPMAGPGGAAPGQMPFIRNAAMSQVLGPLMQQNYGLPIVSPFGQPKSPPPGIGGPFSGLGIPMSGIGGGIPRAFSM